MCLVLMLATAAGAQILKGTLRVGTQDMPAEFLKLDDNTVAVGNGRNACVSQLKAEGTVTIPGTVTIDGKEYKVKAISRFAFRFCNGLTGVNIQENCERVEEFAFQGCPLISNITLPASMKTLGSCAFASCYDNLSSVTCLGDEPAQWERMDVFRRVTSTDHVLYPETKVLHTDSVDNYSKAYGWKLFANVKFGKAIYHAYDAMDINLFREYINQGIEHAYVNLLVLENDIDMGDASWKWGIGRSDTEPYLGSVDGQGHTISNLYVDGIYYPAFFAHFGGSYIKNIGFKNIHVWNHEPYGNAAVVMNYGACHNIEKVWLEDCSVRGGKYLGGIVAESCVGNMFRECVVKDLTLSPSLNISRVGALAGIASDGWAIDCGVIGEFHSHDDDEPELKYSGPFIGACTEGTTFTVRTSMSTQQRFAIHVPEKELVYDHVLLCGQQLNITDTDGTKKQVTLNESDMKGLLPAAVLGDDWFYTEGEYPYPDDYLPEKGKVEVNKAIYTLGSVGNISELPANVLRGGLGSYFLDLSPKGYVSKDYYTDKVWIDDNFKSGKGMLPIGTATIQSSGGVDYDRTLTTDATYTIIQKVQPIDVDKDGEPALDKNGDYILVGDGQDIGTQEAQLAKGHSVCLPYDFAPNGTARIFQPAGFKDDGNVITAYMKEAKKIEAWKPCLVTIEQESMPLSTTAAVLFKPRNGNEYMPDDSRCGMIGTNDKEGDEEHTYYALNDDEIWRGIDRSKVLPFRSYFTLKDGQGTEEFTTGMGFRAELQSDTLKFLMGMPVTDEDQSWWLLYYNKPDQRPRWAEDAWYISGARFMPSFGAARPVSTHAWFQNCEQLNSVYGLEYLNVSETRDMSDMFAACTSLRELDLSTFNTRVLRNTERMFDQCIRLEKVVIGKDWNMAPVERSVNMFYNCISITGQFGRTYFDNGTNKELANATFNGYLWKKYPYYIVRLGASPGTIIFEGSDVAPDGINTYDATDTGSETPGWHRYYDLGINSAVINASFSFAKPKSCYKWFAHKNLTAASGFEYLDGNSITNMASMFEGCQATRLNLLGMETHRVTDMTAMFKGCDKLTRLDVTGFNTSLVHSMSDMFAGCTNLRELDLSAFKTFNVTSMQGMLQGCQALTTLDLNDFNTEKLDNTAGMFNGCTSLQTIMCDNAWEEPTQTDGMFASCTSLVGAVKYDATKTSGDMANAQTGYFTATPAIQLLDRGDNSAVFEQYNGKKVTVNYDRVLASTQNSDGTWNRKAFTICLPYDLNLVHQMVDDKVDIYKFKMLTDDNCLVFIKSNEDGGMLYAGEPYLVVVNEGEVSLNATRVVLKTTPGEGDDVVLASSDPERNLQAVGKWRGLFTDQTNDWATKNHAYGLSVRGMYERYTDTAPQYRAAYPFAFRSYIFFNDYTGINTYTISYFSAGQEEYDDFREIQEYDADYIIDSSTGVKNIRVVTGEDKEEYYDLMGRPLQAPPAQGIYISNGIKKTAK